MKAIVIFLFCCFSVFLSSGCNSYCLTVDGKYQEWSGGLTWCVDQKQSQEVGQPVVKNEVGKSAILVNEEEATLITEILAKESTQESKGVRASSVSNFAEFTKFLRESMQKNNAQKK